jgi:DNA mismatch repair protein MutS
VIARAREVLHEHEAAEHALSGSVAEDEAAPPAAQLTIFTPLPQKIVDQLKATDVDRLTPLEALKLLHELKTQID